MFPVRYELDYYILFRNNAVFKAGGWRNSSGLKAPRAARQLNTVMSPVVLGTKNYCAGEDQQRFTSQPLKN
jgi:hypothetical protein